MDFNTRLRDLIADMKLDGRYRTFIELERLAGEFPTALWHRPNGGTQRVTVWCSNDYLGMGQHPDVLAAMRKTLDLSGAGTGGTRNISGTNRQHVALETELADLHVRVDFESGGARHAGATDARLCHLLRCAQSQFNDRGHPPLWRGAVHL